VQCAAVLSLGLLFAGSAHRMMTELLVAEIGRRPSDRALHDREGYSLAAGFALGCVCLGLGADAPGLADLQLHTWLLRYIHGGPDMPMPGAATRDQKQNPNHDPATCSSVIAEGEGINVSITSPAGCVALALMFLRTNCEAVASRIVIPQNIFQLDYIRPDFAMLRLVARCLIMWDSIEASSEWVYDQLPQFLTQLQSNSDGPSEPGPAVNSAAQELPTSPDAAGLLQHDRASMRLGTPPAIEPMHSPQAPLLSRVADSAQEVGADRALQSTGVPMGFNTPSPTGGPQTGFGGPQGPVHRADALMGELNSGSASGNGFESEIDWLLVGQTKVSLLAGACLAIGLRFAGTADPSAKRLLIEKLLYFRDTRRSTAHPAFMASLPTPDMDLDRSTLETCQSVTAVALGMVMAGTGDLASLRILRSLRKRADLETSYGVHMATHTAIGFVFMGGGKYTFNQDPLSIAALLMAAFPRWPISLTDNRCHLQAFRHLYVLAARHRCVEAIEVDTHQPVDVMVSLNSNHGDETAMLPRLMLSAGEVQSIRLQSERYWPVAIRRELPGENSAVGRWMRALEDSRRLYVKRRSGHLPHRLDLLGAQGAVQAWFPTFTKPEREHLERLLQIPKSDVGGQGQTSKIGSIMLSWLWRADVESGGGPLGLGTLTVSSAEWAAALCCEPSPLLPDNVYEFDFVDADDGSLCERFAGLLNEELTANSNGSKLRPPHVCFAHWLHECIIDSKLTAYPLYLLLYLQTRASLDDTVNAASLRCTPASLMCSAMAIDQLITVEQFYRMVRRGIGASHSPLLSEDFLVDRCAAVRQALGLEGPLAHKLAAALRAQYHAEGRDGATPAGAASQTALAGLFTRLHGLPGHITRLDSFAGHGKALRALPRLRRHLPGASAQGLQALAAALSGA